MRKINFILGIFLFSLGAFAQSTIINIPDVNFKNALINHNPVIDISGDGEIQSVEALLYTKKLKLEGKGIQDLTGIEAFVNIEKLYCSNNQLTSLDLSQNTRLEKVYCENNQLTSLNIGANTRLEKLNCNNNLLTHLDLSASTKLEKLYCENNLLSSLNIANGFNYRIEHLSAQNNPSLTCIQIDEGFLPPFSWIKDPQTSYNSTCNYASVENVREIKVQVYPNPTTSILNIECEQEVRQVIVYDFSGNIVLAIKNQNIIEVDRLAIGVYFIEVQTAEGKTIRKFIKK